MPPPICERTFIILCETSLVLKKDKCLRIPTGKKQSKIKLQRLQKVQIWTFGLLVQQINSL